MSENPPCCVLTINSGSSSLKFAVYQMAPEETLTFSGIIERIGLRGSRFFVARCPAPDVDRRASRSARPRRRDQGPVRLAANPAAAAAGWTRPVIGWCTAGVDYNQPQPDQRRSPGRRSKRWFAWRPSTCRTS